MRDLAGKTAFITGAAGGIGYALATALTGRGMKVALADRDLARLKPAAQELSATGATVHAVSLDVTDFDDWGRAVDAAEAALGPIALLVNNAGIGGGVHVAEDDPVRWRAVLEVNALGPFHGCRTLLPRMLARGEDAHIVNIASLSGLRSNPGMSSYDASKHALVGLSGSLRAELEGTRVGLSVVYPGMTRTDFVQNSREMIAETKGVAVSLATGVGNLLAGGMDPAKLAERVVRGVEEGEYHIFTHVDWKPMIQAVFDERIAAFGENADPAYSENIEGLWVRIAEARSIAQAEGVGH